MEYIFLIITTVLCCYQNINVKQYEIKTKNPDSSVFSAVSAFFALIFFAADALIEYGFVFNFEPAAILYSVAFGFTYAMATIGSVLAIKFGSLAISMLVSSYSLLIPTFYGIVILKEPVSKYAYAGIVLLLISTFLINAKHEEGGVKFSLKWVIALAVGFVGNGMCSTIQKMQQVRFKGAYKNEFMMVALVIAVVLFLATFFFSANGRNRNAVRQSKDDVKNAFVHGIPKGIANGAVNLLMLKLTGMLPNAILYPVVSAGGIVLGFFVAIYVYKEKLSRQQLVGYVLGVGSVILLNI